MSGHHDHRDVERDALGPFLEQRDAVAVRHPDIEQYEVRPPGPARLARVFGVVGERDLVALVFQDLAQERADIGFVIDDQEMLGAHSARAARAGDSAPAVTGSRITAQAPAAGRFSTQTIPPCSSMIFFTMASPRPVPLGLLVM